MYLNAKVKSRFWLAFLLSFLLIVGCAGQQVKPDTPMVEKQSTISSPCGDLAVSGDFKLETTDLNAYRMYDTATDSSIIFAHTMHKGQDVYFLMFAVSEDCVDGFPLGVVNVDGQPWPQTQMISFVDSTWPGGPKKVYGYALGVVGKDDFVYNMNISNAPLYMIFENEAAIHFKITPQCWEEVTTYLFEE